MAQPSTASSEEVLDAALAASRVLLAIAIRSVSQVDAGLTVVQYRALTVMSYAGPQRTMDLAAELAVSSSTATRLIDRLVRRDLVERRTPPEDRRATEVVITEAGRVLVANVMALRREEFSTILRRVPAEKRRMLADALEMFRQAAGEAPESSWTTGWTP